MTDFVQPGAGHRTAPLCRCARPLINLEGICTICGLERLHIKPKVKPAAAIDDSDALDAEAS